MASELAALSVEEASAPPDSNGEKPSAEPAEGADPGGKITGVVSWFNVAKGFGARAWSFQSGNHRFPHARVRAARRPRARAREARSRCLAASLSSPDRSTRALAWLRIRPRASRFPARHVPRHARPMLILRSPYASPKRRLRDARRRRRGRLRAPERHLQPGVPQLAESGARGVRPRAHRRRAVQSRERASDPSPSGSHARRIEKHRTLFVFFFCFFRESDTRPPFPTTNVSSAHR